MPGPAPDLLPGVPGVSFADINADMEGDVFGCTGTSAGCHAAGADFKGTGKPKGIMQLKKGFPPDTGVLMPNYMEVLKEVDLGKPENSNLLLRPLVDPGIDHTGGKIPDPNKTTYTKWLNWIRLGAKFDFVPFSNLSDDAGTGSPDDMSNGGG